MSYKLVKKMTISAIPDHNFQMMGLHLLLLWKFSRFAGQTFMEESSVVYLDYGDRFNILFSLVVIYMHILPLQLLMTNTNPILEHGPGGCRQHVISKAFGIHNHST
jgi:hypothetical protein